jgi:hypothetical protein
MWLVLFWLIDKKDEVIEMKNFPSKYVDYGTETLDVYYEPYQLESR